MEYAIEIENLSKSFRDFWLRPLAKALNGISLKVPKGGIFGLLGPNGSGKSTTVKCILGLLKPSGGTVRVFGENPRKASVRSRIGYLPETTNLHPLLTARETVLYYAGLSGVNSSTAKKRTAQLLEMMSLSHVADRAVGGFSKGMARRVGIAASLVSKPELLILDEPTSGLDPVASVETKTLVKTLAANGVTILTTSHLLADAADVCDRIAILSRGSIAAEGNVKDILQKKDEISFTVKNMSETRIAETAALLKKETGGDVTISRPGRTLESFFMEAVSENISTFQPADFLVSADRLEKAQ